MTLADLGYTESLEEFRNNQNLNNFEVGRIASEHKERYQIKTAVGEFEGEILGNLRFTAQSRADFPAVGDWVAISAYDEGKVLIHKVYPRKTIIARKAVSKKGEKQIIATNIDVAFIVQAVDRDFSINRAERYLTICYAAKIKPVIILNKIDLVDAAKLEQLVTTVTKRIKGVPIYTISNTSKQGINVLKQLIEKGKTYCLLGSSGVGKSSLLNNLLGEAHMQTNEISSSNAKGRHVTTHRELIVLQDGGIVIDNPGMREVGIADAAVGLEETFNEILEYAQNCRFKDCTHTNEMGCAVLEAVDSGQLDSSAYDNFMKMEREQERFETTIAEKRKKDKAFGKMIKRVVKDRKSNKF